MKKLEEPLLGISQKLIDELDKVFRTSVITEEQIRKAKELFQEKYIEFTTEEDRSKWYPELHIIAEKNEITIEWKDVLH